MDDGPAKEQKLLVETLKAKVMRLQAESGEKRAAAQGTFPHRTELFRSWEGAKKALKAGQQELIAAKVALVKLCGTRGGDPKWDLIREAWHVLSRLDEDGVEIGDRGRSLIDEIEFHVPLSKLHQDILGDAAPSRPAQGDEP